MALETRTREAEMMVEDVGVDEFTSLRLVLEGKAKRARTEL